MRTLSFFFVPDRLLKTLKVLTAQILWRDETLVNYMTIIAPQTTKNCPQLCNCNQGYWNTAKYFDFANWSIIAFSVFANWQAILIAFWRDFIFEFSKRVLAMSHYPPTTVRPGLCSKSDTLRQKFYWPHIAASVDYVVRNCTSSARNSSKYRHRRIVKLLLANEPLELISMDNFGLLPKTSWSKHYNFCMTDRFFILTRTRPVSRTITTHIGNVFMAQLLFSCDLPAYLPTGIGAQLVINIFATVCALQWINYVSTTLYHPQANDLPERVNKTIFTRLWHYEAERQKNWDSFVQPLTHEYSAKVHRSTKQTPFSLSLRRQPPKVTLLECSSALSNEGYAKCSQKVLRWRLEARIPTLRAEADAAMTSVQQRYR